VSATLLENRLDSLGIEVVLTLLHCNQLLVQDHLMFEGNGSLKGALNVHFAVASTTNPLGELEVVRECSGEHNEPNMLWKLHNDFLPNVASLSIVHVMDLIKDDPLNILKIVVVDEAELLQHLSGHDHAGSVSVDSDVASDNTHIFILLLEIPELLVGQRLDRSGVDGLCHVLKGQGDRVLSDNSLTCRSVGSNEDVGSLFHSEHGSLLEGVEFERVGHGATSWGEHLVEISDCHLVLNSVHFSFLHHFHRLVKVRGWPCLLHLFTVFIELSFAFLGLDAEGDLLLLLHSVSQVELGRQSPGFGRWGTSHDQLDLVVIVAASCFGVLLLLRNWLGQIFGLRCLLLLPHQQCHLVFTFLAAAAVA